MQIAAMLIFLKKIMLNEISQNQWNRQNDLTHMQDMKKHSRQIDNSKNNRKSRRVISWELATVPGGCIDGKRPLQQ